ncbi:putative Plant invertase/pectin methylesterase inhibitor superfamily [Hibiscus syriacus]|uniref:Plant invertase/pectin methylesterase inhibitor superfamily n=1 Tax=Hibiscus syriacus TaxID=106335 RepID=A0A6A3CNF0_HIBSY|nr:putative Plant invertase/pectin methylesterase inhibitor superfamily [Hibiscus syriacus]
MICHFNLCFREVKVLKLLVRIYPSGGKSPCSKLNLDDILQFSEIVPLNAGNVLVIEDNEPAVKWLALINQSLNKANYVPLRGSKSIASPGSSLVFPKLHLERPAGFGTENKRRLKSCSCPTDLERKYSKEFFGTMPTPGANSMKYSLVASKQMVGIFLTVWMRKELVQHPGHMARGFELQDSFKLLYTGKLLKRKPGMHSEDRKRDRASIQGMERRKIYFAPTYKYSLNSDIYAGETVETKRKRTPAWCDRILWHGSEIYQLSYERKESRFSDHRPVCSTFWVSVEATEDGSKKR